MKIKFLNDILYKVYAGKDYKLLDFGDNPDRTEPNANDIVTQILMFEKEVFGTEMFKITDNRLFDKWPTGISTPETFVIGAKLLPSLCTIEFVYVNWIQTGELNSNCDPTFEHCFDLVPVYSSVIVTTFCWDDDGGGDGGGDWYPAPTYPDPNTGGGGSGGNNQLPPEQCRELGWEKIINYENREFTTNCGTFPMPDNIDVPDDNGFYPSQFEELNNYFINHPLAMNPCDEIAAFNILGSLFQNLATFTPSYPVRARLNQIRANQPGWIVDDYNIQYLEHAYGGVVNCDYFPVPIGNLPMKNQTQRFSPQEFLEYLRLHLNDFTGGIAAFTCTFTWWNDCNKWNSSYQSSLGSLYSVRIHGPQGTFDDGSLILSAYGSTVSSTGSIPESYYFTFSTIETPFDGEHPVAGNRTFGIYNTRSNPNLWTFYTTAVDRTWDIFSATLNDRFGGFEKADELWSTVQGKLITFINSHGGSAINPTPTNMISRPQWNDVKEYLRKHITLQELKTRLGC